MKRTLTLAQYEEAIDANFVLVLIGKRDIPKKNTLGNSRNLDFKKLVNTQFSIFIGSTIVN